jgi:hypothetical protein
VLRDLEVGAALLHEILSTTPLYSKGKFLRNIEYTSADFEAFIEKSKLLRRFVEGQFDVATRKDINSKPVKHLSNLLKILGLKSYETRTQKVATKKVYYYKIEEGALDQMLQFVSQRESVKGWESVNQTYGFEQPSEAKENSDYGHWNI